jgi:glycosyltransferase involved in cell wall biosynthesis
MRVALVAYWFNDYCVAQANALAEHVEISLLFPDGMLGRSQEILSPRLEHVPIPKHGRRSPLNLLAVPELVKLIRSRRPDVIHVHANGHTRLMLALPWLRNIPLVVTVHDPVPHQGETSWLRRWTNRIMRRRGDQFLLHGEALCRRFQESWGVARDRMTSVQHGALDYSRWRDPSVTPPARGHILLFGRIRPYKGIPVLIEAARRLRRPPENLKIVIAGRGVDFAPYRAQIEATGQRERFVILNEHISEAMVDALFREARAVVLPYTQASQSGPASTAFAYGKPVVASAVGGLPEVVREGETGLLVPPGDAQALADALNRLAEDDALAARLSEGARRLGETELSWSALAEPVVAAYERAIAVHPRRGR